MATRTVVGSKPTVPHPQEGKTVPQRAFRPDLEDYETSGDPPPAVIINPGANGSSLIAALRSRARRLEKHLYQATFLPNDEVTAAVLAEPLWCLAQEIVILLEATKATEVGHA